MIVLSAIAFIALTLLAVTAFIVLLKVHRTTAQQSQEAFTQLTNLTRQLALLNKAPDVVIGQSAVEVDRNNTMFLEQEALRFDKLSTPTVEDAPPPKEKKPVLVGGSAFEIVGMSQEAEDEFLEGLEEKEKN